MSRPLAVFLPLATPLDRAIERLLDEPSSWLPDGLPQGAHDHRVLLHGAGIDWPVVATIGTTRLVDDGCWRSFSWEPVAAGEDLLPLDRLLPSFVGELGVHGDLGDHATLVLDGHYHVPGSRVGQLIDQLALSRVARRSAERLLGGIAARLTATNATSVG